MGEAGRTHWGVRVLKSDYASLAAEADPDTPYDSDSVDYDVRVLGVELDDANPDVVAPFKPEPGEWLHLVCVRRSSGDSFHTDTGLFEAIGLYRTREKAELAAAAIEEHNEFEDALLANASRLGVLDERGEPALVAVIWRDYFDRLESVRVERVQAR